MAGEDVQSIVLSYKYRLLPTRAQHRALERILEDQRQLYNAAMQERIDCYRKTGGTRTYMDQCKALTEWRGDDPCAAITPANMQRWTIKRIDDAYKSFFRRLKDRNGRAGFPRFRGMGHFNSFGFNEFSGIRFDGKRIRFSGLPSGLRVHMHRAMPEDKILSCTFTRDVKGWSVGFQVRVPCAEKRHLARSIGVDVGLTNLATLSDGSVIPNVRPAQRAERELRRRQRALARCSRGSNRRNKVKVRVARLRRMVSSTRATYLHQVSADIVSRFDLIAVERLNVRGLARSILAKSVHDVSWGKFLQLLAYKAEKAGVRLIEVDPRNTTQACSGCGVIVKKSLSVRTHECVTCGLSLDRDHNAATNILRKAVTGLGVQNATRCSERAHRNIICEGVAA